MKRRLNIAVAGMLHNPSILILDEPTVGVDAQSRQHIFDHIQSLAEQGTTILYIVSLYGEISLCKRVFILDLGRRSAWYERSENSWGIHRGAYIGPRLLDLTKCWRIAKTASNL